MRNRQFLCLPFDMGWVEYLLGARLRPFRAGGHFVNYGSNVLSSFRAEGDVVNYGYNVLRPFRAGGYVVNYSSNEWHPFGAGGSCR